MQFVIRILSASKACKCAQVLRALARRNGRARVRSAHAWVYNVLAGVAESVSCGAVAGMRGGRSWREMCFLERCERETRRALNSFHSHIYCPAFGTFFECKSLSSFQAHPVSTGTHFATWTSRASPADEQGEASLHCRRLSVCVSSRQRGSSFIERGGTAHTPVIFSKGKVKTHGRACSMRSRAAELELPA